MKCAALCDSKSIFAFENGIRKGPQNILNFFDIIALKW